jgi:O-antigen ligase
MGALAALGTLLALGVASDARSRALRAFASAAPVVFVPTLVFSASRGAAISLVAGLVVALALHRARARFALVTAVAALPAAAGGLLAARSRALTAEPSSLHAAAREGHRLALALLLLAGLALLIPLVVDAAAPKLPRLPHLPPRAVAVLATVAVVGGALAAVALGGKAYDAFRMPTPFGETGLRSHLFSLSGHDRTSYWRVALDDYRDHPALGSGAGTYDLYWTRDRPFGTGARDAHSLYVETLAELGPLGLALLLAALAAPFTAVRFARERPLVPALAGAYAAYLVHAAADWDWEIPALTLTALVCGALLAVSDTRAVIVRARPILIGAAVGIAAVAVAIQRGNDAAADAGALLGDGRNREAVRAAERASRWAPWAAEPWRVRADAERALGDAQAARRSARRAIAKDPRDWIGWFQLAYLTNGQEHAGADARVRALNPLAPP